MGAKSHWIGLVLAIGFVLVLVMFAVSNDTEAQLSCDNPPMDTSRLALVWDKTDFCAYQEGVYEEIISGGVPRDGIPPIDDPQFESVEDAAGWLEPQSPVIALAVGEVARAYPLAILTRHEIVNDVIDGTPVAVTFCPLCNSAIVFVRRVDGQTLRFGVSGLLRNSDLIMWDDRTQSWWQQFTGEGIVGEYTGRQLELVPSQIVGFGAFADQHPGGQVLSRQGRSYGTNPYVGYDSDPQPFLFPGELDDRLFPTERVLAGIIGGQPMAYPFSVLSEEGVINDTVGGQAVVAFWQPGAASALDRSRIDDSQDVGMAALFSRELDGQTLSFYVDDDGFIRDTQTESQWNVFGTAISGQMTGEQLRQLLAGAHFWFAWVAFSPDTTVYGLAG
jgi:hypothetical protein